MIEISHLNEKEKLTALSKEVQETIQSVLQVLDTEYGADDVNGFKRENGINGVS